MEEIIDFSYRERGKDSLINKKHAHTQHYEILHICAGTGVIMINNRLYTIERDTVFFINGIDIHCSVPEDPKAYVRSKLVISNAFIRSIAGIAGISEVISDLFINASGICIALQADEAARIDAEMLKIRDSLSCANLYQKANVMLSVFKILLCAHENIKHYTHPITNKMSDVLLYLNANIEKKITLEQLCTQFHVSKYYLCHTFKKTTGMTIFDYILARRISIAKRKLIYSDTPLAEVSLSTGFCSFSYFSKVFKEFEGITPTQFRKNYNSNLLARTGI